MTQYSAVQGYLPFIGYASKQRTRYMCRSTRAPSICTGFLIRINGRERWDHTIAHALENSKVYKDANVT